MALLSVIERQIKRALREAERLRGDGGSRLVESHHSVLESSPLRAAQQLGSRHAALLEMGLVDGHAPDAHQILAFTDLKPRRASLDYEPGHSTGPALRIDSGEYCKEVGRARIGGPLLIA